MRTNIGIFLCDCGKSLKNIDFEMVRKKAGEFQNAVHVGLSSALCLKEGLEEMVSTIRGNGVNRVVIGACSPLLKETVFRKALEKAGLDSSSLSMANIREQCSWVHQTDVTEKALEMIRMAVNRVRLIKEIVREEVEVTREVLVVGGGLSGMKSALEISRLGLRPTLVEREPTLGGEGFYVLKPFPGETIDSMAKAVEEDENIEVLTEASVVKVDGDVGSFSVRIRRGGKEFYRTFGAIVFATGQMTEISSADFKQTSNIVSQQGFVKMLQVPEKFSKRPEVIAFVLDLSGESSRLSTLSALNNALAVKEKLGSEVYVFCKNLKVDSEGVETLYREVRNRGVVFVKFEEKPKIESCEDGRVRIEARELLLGDEVTLFCDLLVVEAKPSPSKGAESLSSMLKVGTDSQGFYQDENVHLYPVFSRRKGMFFVGSCRGDLDPTRTWMDVSNVAMNLYELLSGGKVRVEVDKVKAEPDKCQACLTCIRVCPHSAIRLVGSERSGETKRPFINEKREVAQIHDLACDECGICTSICPAKAIEFSGFSDEQILAEIEAMEEGRIVVFCCAESAYPVADSVGKLGVHYPPQIRVISVPCVGRVDLIHILKAFEKGAAGVLVMGCQEGACQHLEGNTRAKERVKYAQDLLEEMGMDRESVKLVNLGPNMAWKFSEEASRIVERTEEGKR